MPDSRHCPRCGKNYPADALFCPEDGTSLASMEVGEKAGVVLGERYLLEARIGAGGLGEIYRARHLRMQRAFAVKLLQPNMVKRSDFVGRFDREAQALSRLAHPCCVAVSDYGISDDHGPYIVMELIDGSPLSRFTRGEGLPLGEALDLVIAVLAGLEHAHGQGIVHRDIKPDNIMIVEQPLQPGRRLPKILDFGLAKIRSGFNAPAGQTLTEMGFVIGTPHYLPPERVTQPTADDPRSDLYAVGVVLYELCCGIRPFEAEETARVIEMQLNDSPPPPSRWRPDLPPPLEAIILRALEKQPETRFASALEFRQALEALLPLPEALAAERPGEARRTGSQTRVERPVRGAPPSAPSQAPVVLTRRGWRLRLLLAGVVLLLLGTAVGVWLLSSGTDARRSTSRAGQGRSRARVVQQPAARPSAPPLSGAKAGAAGSSSSASTSGPAEDSDDGSEASDSSNDEPPSAAGSSQSLPGELQQAYRLWSNPRTRSHAARQFMSYLARHRSDAASHVFVGRLYLYVLWASDGVKLVQRGLRADPTLRLDAETLMGLAFAYRGSTQWAARRILEGQAGAELPHILLAAATVTRDRRIKQVLMAEARRRGTLDPLARQLLELAGASSCAERRQALQALSSLEPPCIKVMLKMLRSHRCLAREVGELLDRAH